MQQLLIARLSYHRFEFINRAVNQAIGGTVGIEIIVLHIKTRAVGNSRADILRE